MTVPWSTAKVFRSPHPDEPDCTVHPKDRLQGQQLLPQVNQFHLSFLLFVAIVSSHQPYLCSYLPYSLRLKLTSSWRKSSRAELCIHPEWWHWSRMVKQELKYADICVVMCFLTMLQINALDCIWLSSFTRFILDLCHLVQHLRCSHLCTVLIICSISLPLLMVFPFCPWCHFYFFPPSVSVNLFSSTFFSEFAPLSVKLSKPSAPVPSFHYPFICSLLSHCPPAAIHSLKLSRTHVDWHSVDEVYLYSDATTSKIARTVTQKLGFSKGQWSSIIILLKHPVQYKTNLTCSDSK